MFHSFDFLIIAVTDIVLIVSAFTSNDISTIATMIRALRIGRIVKYVSFMKVRNNFKDSCIQEV
jgi:hypothetical protein